MSFAACATRSASGGCESYGSTSLGDSSPELADSPALERLCKVRSIHGSSFHVTPGEVTELVPNTPRTCATERLLNNPRLSPITRVLKTSPRLAQ